MDFCEIGADLWFHNRMIMKHTFQVPPLTPPSPRSAERYLPSKKLGVRGVRGDT